MDNGHRHSRGAMTVAIRAHCQKIVTDLYNTIEDGIPFQALRPALRIRGSLLTEAAGHLWLGLLWWCCSIAHRSPARGSAALLPGSGRVEGGSNLSAGAFLVAWPPHSFSPVFLYPGSNRSLWLRRPLWGNSSHRRLPGLPGGGSGRTLRSLLWQ